MSNTRETIESLDENKELAETREKLEKTIRYLIDNEKVLEEHYNKVFEETKDIDGILPPGRNFRLEVIKSWSGLPFTKDDLNKINPDLVDELYDRVFKIQLRLRKEQKQNELNPPTPEEPERLREEERRKKAKRHFPKGYSGAEAAQPGFFKEED